MGCGGSAAATHEYKNSECGKQEKASKNNIAFRCNQIAP
jgi:hypothetical protein